MKKKILSILTVLCALVLPDRGLWADSADKHPFILNQPDGSTVTLVRHGDEFFSYTTDPSGNIMEKGADGFYRTAPSGGTKLREARLQGEAMRQRRNEFLHIGQRNENLTRGEKRFLVILIEWQDLKFKTTDAGNKFSQLLNQNGYSQNGSIGSAKDYYIDASLGQFSPSFDVYGPVTLPFNHNAWPDNDSANHYEMAAHSIHEALGMIDAVVDFSQYDLDKDGILDNIYCFYAGEAQSNGGGDDTIWPHAWALHIYDDKYDDVRPWSYACSSELVKDYSAYPEVNLKMCGIGTFCHEFGHVLGLPDYYDTDYGTNGQADHPDEFSLMSGGNHNSGGYIPPYMNNIERECLGWYEIPTLSTRGDKTLLSLAEGCGMQVHTKVPGERFILELRDGTKWDAPLPKGMIIYHADASERIILGKSAARRWAEGDGINIYGEHPCLYLVPAYGTSYNPNSVSYPGSHNVTSFVPEDWDGGKMGDLISGITYGGGKSISFKYDIGGFVLRGTVSDSGGNPIAGATVAMGRKGKGSKAVPSMHLEEDGLKLRITSSAIRTAAADITTSTDADGKYYIYVDDNTTLLYEVTASKEYYLDATKEVNFSMGSSQDLDFTLKAIVVPGGGVLTHFTDNGYYTFLGTGSAPQSISGASKFEAADIGSFVGCTLQSITFPLTGTKADRVYVLVEAGSERILTQEVKGCTFGGDTYTLNTVDLSSFGFVVPKDKDITIGYILVNIDDDYPLLMDTVAGVPGGLLYYISDTTDPHQWYSINDGSLMIFAQFKGHNRISDEMDPSTLGINYILLPSEGLTAGKTLPLIVIPSELYEVSNVKWSFDGQAVGTSVVLTSGKHDITAQVTFSDSHTETIKARISVK